MTTSDDKGGMGPPQACLAHDYDMMKPVVLATWKHGFQGACPDKSAILAESQVKIKIFLTKFPTNFSYITLTFEMNFMRYFNIMSILNSFILNYLSCRKMKVINLSHGKSVTFGISPNVEIEEIYNDNVLKVDSADSSYCIMYIYIQR